MPDRLEFHTFNTPPSNRENDGKAKIDSHAIFDTDGCVVNLSDEVDRPTVTVRFEELRRIISLAKKLETQMKMYIKEANEAMYVTFDYFTYCKVRFTMASMIDMEETTNEATSRETSSMMSRSTRSSNTMGTTRSGVSSYSNRKVADDDELYQTGMEEMERMIK